MAPAAPGVLSTLFKEQGWNVSFRDENVKGRVPEKWLRDADLVLLTGLTPAYYRMNELSKYCRDNKIYLVVGGVDAIGWGRVPGGFGLLANRYDSFCTTFLTTDLVKQIIADWKKHHLQQLYAVAFGTKYQHVPQDRTIYRKGDYHSLTLLSSRGCPNNCSFCVVGGQSMSYKPIEMLRAELKDLKKLHPLAFTDACDTFAASRKKAEEVIQEYAKAGIPWVTEAAASDLLRDDGRMINLMAKGGCKAIYFGVERVLGTVHSKTSADMALEVIDRCRSEHITPVGSFILDVAEDVTEKEILFTIEWATRNFGIAQFSLRSASPGCPDYLEAVRDGTIIDDNLEHYDGGWPTLEHQIAPERRRELLIKAYRDFSEPRWVIRRLLNTSGFVPWLALAASSWRYRKGALALK